MFVTVFCFVSVGQAWDGGGVHPYSPVLSSSNPSDFVCSPPLPSIEEPLRMSQFKAHQGGVGLCSPAEVEGLHLPIPSSSWSQRRKGKAARILSSISVGQVEALSPG